MFNDSNAFIAFGFCLGYIFGLVAVIVRDICDLIHSRKEHE